MKNNNNKNFLKFSSFTLIELIIVLAIISILVTILIATIKPTEIFKKTRDSKRIADLKNIEKTMDLLYSTYPNFNELNYASTNIVYISLKDDSPTCSSYISQLPSLPPGYQYRCSANPQNIDGTGWIPIPFKNFDIINLANLPIDPINQPPYYYTFVVGGSYKVTAKPEINYSPAINDGGIEPLLYEAGSNKKLSTFQSGLVLYLPFDEGTGTIAYDLSGYRNNGTLYNFNFTATSGWTTGKVGRALSFDGVDDYVIHNTTTGIIKNITIVAWVKTPTEWTAGPSPQIVTDSSNVTDGYGVNLWLAITGYPPTRRFAFTLNIIGWGPDDIRVNFEPQLDTWYHVVGVRQEPNLYLYINGVLAASKVGSYGTIKYGGSPRVEIGTKMEPNLSRTDWKWKGIIDEVRLYNRALSDAEIKALYEATK